MLLFVLSRYQFILQRKVKGTAPNNNTKITGQLDGTQQHRMCGVFNGESLAGSERFLFYIEKSEKH